MIDTSLFYPSRQIVVALARTWLGTPYHHQASVKSIGCDCVGLIRGLFAELYGQFPVSAASVAYTRDWAEATGEETLIVAARRHLVEIAPTSAKPGDVIVFRYRERMVAKHTGLLAMAPDGAPTLIHALEAAPLSEVPLLPWWQRRIAAAFSFPGIID